MGVRASLRSGVVGKVSGMNGRLHRQLLASVGVALGATVVFLALQKSAGVAGVVLGIVILWLAATAFIVRRIRIEARRQGRSPTVRMLFEGAPAPKNR